MNTKIFLDSGDPDETREVLRLLGFLHGQTTNPSLVSKNPDAKKRLERGEKFAFQELSGLYREIVQEVSSLIPEGSVSIEVYADESTEADHMLVQARDMFTWIPNAHIKFPTTKQGLRAARQALQEGMRVNMTLVFSQQQAAAVYAATAGAKRGDVFVSPFIGRLEDRGENGMNLIENIVKMYQKGDGHVEVLTASVRSKEHLLQAMRLSSDIITSPFSVIKDWAEHGAPAPDEKFDYTADGLKNIAFEEIDLNKDWTEFDISHDLTDTGLKKFAEDWNKLLAS